MINKHIIKMQNATSKIIIYYNSTNSQFMSKKDYYFKGKSLNVMTTFF